MEQFDIAISINPTYAEALYNRGTANLDQGALLGAISDLTQAIISLDRVSADGGGRAYLPTLGTNSVDSDQKNLKARAFFNRGRAYQCHGPIQASSF
ncbi:hypothetical protein [Mesorhizobium mediterraneum]|uniref:hypothetical protein n=1 Tax=Mesorhizobium mediterraneum TaxID=43617 RepID=UPI003D7C60BA